MAGGAALALQQLAPAPSLSQQQQQQQQQAKEQLQKAVTMNAFLLKGHFLGGPNALPPSDLNHLIVAFARGIDYALSGGDVPTIAPEIPDTMRKVYQLRNDLFLQSSVMSLIVVQKENLDVSSCIANPLHVSFLVNGKGVDKRNNVSMMLKYGANILQAVGYFNANYIIAVASVNNLISFDAPKLNDYAQPVTTDLPDSDILEGPSRVTLKCPISFRRMKTPVKGRLCKHHQCFDYDNYMEMNLKKPTWRCSFCNTPASFIDLRIDQKMAKVLQETGDDITDVLVFPDGSWKAVYDEKSDRHAGDIVQQNGDTVDTDATPSDVIDLVNRDDDGDTYMSLASTPEDLKPVLNSQDLSVTDYLLDIPVNTTAQSEDPHVGSGNIGSSNGTSTSVQNLLPLPSGSGSGSFGTLESILPRDIMQMQPATPETVSPFIGTPSLTFSMQQISQGAYLQSQLGSLARSDVAQHSLPRNFRRDPVAVQALAVPHQNSSRRVQPNVLSGPSPMSQSISASPNYQTHHVTNADSVITSMINGVGPHSRAPDGSSSLHLQSAQQDIRKMGVMGLAAPPYMHMRSTTGGSGQGRGANAYGASFPQQQQHFDQRQLDSLMGQFTNQGGTVSQGIPSHLSAPQQSQALRLQAVSQPGTPRVQPRVQSPGLPRVQSPGQPPVAPATLLVEASDAQELQMDPNWQPTGRMRGSLVGNDYDRALERYLRSGGQRTGQAQPPGR
uniref:Uncharacterized protein n=1 Tax=Avena sativa TaxID=4498 RepID=A0ACD6ACP3_AVESA